jgi:hypothetical protein
LKVGYASSRAHNNNNTSRSGFHDSHGVFKSFVQAARVEGGLCEFARDTTTTPTLTPTPTTRALTTATVSSKASRMTLGLKVAYVSSRAHDNNTSRSGFHNSHWVFKGFAQAARIEDGLCEFACTTTTSTLTPIPTRCVFITPTVSSKASRRPLGLKVGYVSSRKHHNNTNRSCFHNSHGVFESFVQAASRVHNNNNDTNTNINTNYNNNYNNNNTFARARQQTRPVARVWLFIIN